MVESRWPRRIGPVLATVGAVVVAAATTTGDPGAWLPPPCVGPPGPGPGGIGTWYRLDPVITDGIRTGQRLSVGRGDGDAAAHVDLDPESFASGPFGGTILSGTDDGRTSRLSLLDLGAGCAWAVGRSGHVVRHATLTPDGRSIVEFRVDRRTRSDLGVWARPLDGGDAEPDPRPDRRRRPLRTDLAHAARLEPGRPDARRRVVRRGRLPVPPARHGLRLVGPRRRPVGRLARRGRRRAGHRTWRMPGPALPAARTRPGRWPTGDARRYRGSGGARPRCCRSGTSSSTRSTPTAVWFGPSVRTGATPDPLPLPADGRRLIGPPSWSGGGAELGAGWIPFGPDGRLPVAGDRPAVLRHVSDGRAVRLDEVPR